MKKKAIAAIIILAATSSAFAATGSSLSDWYLIPAVAHAPGNQGTFWQTDVAITNPYTWRSITVGIWYHAANQDNTDANWTSITIPAGEQVTLPDIVLQTFGISKGSGALWLQTDDEAYFTVNARTFTGTTGTYGLMENGQRSVTSGLQSAFISGVKNSSRFRTNVGVASATDRSVSVVVEAYDNDGRFKGEKTLSLEPWGMTQISVNSFADSFSDGYLVLSGMSSSETATWVGYATPIDNSSGDSTFCEARTDAQYTWAQQYYDQTGWWEGSISTAQGSANGYAYIDQIQSQLSIWVYYPDGSFNTRFDGFEDRGTVRLTDMYVYHADCFGSTLEGSNITSESDAIHGNVTIDADNPNDCVDGTATLYLSPMSSSPFKSAAGKRKLTMGDTRNPTEVPKKGTPAEKYHPVVRR